MKIRESEKILREDCTDKEYNEFYELDKIFDENDEEIEYQETEEEKEYCKKYALNRRIEYIRYINNEITPNKLICPKEKESEIDLLFLEFYDWKLFEGEFDYDEYVPKIEEIFDLSNTSQDKLDFIYKYYYSIKYKVKFETLESLINQVKKDIEENKKFILENYPDEYKLHLVK